MGKLNGTRIRRSAQEWSRILARFERGGQSHREFCEREGLAVSTFHCWRRRLGAAQREPPQLAPRLRAAARRLERLFGAVLRPEEIRLGGGTVLAARYGYGHRTSHDLDYWFTETAAERLAQAANEYVWEMMMGRAGELRTDRGGAESGCGG